MGVEEGAQRWNQNVRGLTKTTHCSRFLEHTSTRTFPQGLAVIALRRREMPRNEETPYEESFQEAECQSTRC